MKVRLLAALACLLVLALVGCGGGGGGSDTQSTTPPLQTGVFLDSAVEGLNYTCSPSGITGQTTALGEFDYYQGDNVFFSIGGISLGNAAAKSMVTPLDFHPRTSEEGYPQEVRNIIRLLQSLDTDDNPSNGITLPSTIHQQASGMSLSFRQESADFEIDPDVMALTNNQGLVFEDDALAHFRGTAQTVARNDLQGQYTFSRATVTNLQGVSLLPPGTTITGNMQISGSGALNQTLFVNGTQVIASGTMEIYDHYRLLLNSSGCSYFVKYDYTSFLNSLETIIDTSDLTADGSQTIRACLNLPSDFIETDTWLKSASPQALSLDHGEPSSVDTFGVGSAVASQLY